MKTKNKVDKVQPINENPNPKLSDEQLKSLKKKQIIGICITSVLLAIMIVLVTLVFTIWKK